MTASTNTTVRKKLRKARKKLEARRLAAPKGTRYTLPGSMNPRKQA